jgi:flavorubredoxin
MAKITEIARDIFKISTFIPEIDLEFNQFLVRDDEPMLFHTGLKRLFPQVREAVARLVPPKAIRWIGFSHYEADECGSLNDWLELAPEAQTICSLVGALVSLNDVSIRPPRPMADDEVLETGKHRFRFLRTPHVPHCWEASLLFEETSGTLFCSDILTHNGEVEPVTESDVVGRAKDSLLRAEAGPFADAYPYTQQTDGIMNRLADLRPNVLALMHGSSFVGNGEKALRDYATVLREVGSRQVGRC